jgi:NADH-quinone oxidoreductase subunit C
VDVLESSIVYQDAPPAGVSAAAAKVLGRFEPRWSSFRGDVGVLVPRERWLDVFRGLRAEAGFDYLVDHTAVDYPARQPRFTVVAVLMNLTTQERLIVKTRVAEGEAVASLTSLWHSANWSERETYDMFGIPIEGHPNLTRIYMPEDFEGWPMRRDFPLHGHVRFRD